MRTTPLVLLLLTATLAGCVASDEVEPHGGLDRWAYEPAAPEQPPEPAVPPVAAENITESVDHRIRFIVWGDTGTGEQPQYDVADAALAVCESHGCDFVIQTGDNIYESGVTSVDDAQFEEKFEIPYANFTIPFWLTLGNHDNGDGIGSDSTKGDHQVDYHYRTDPPKMSDKWNMPARYYTFTEVRDNTSVQFFSLDTNTLMYWGDPLYQRDMLGQGQLDWFTSEIEKSNATWRFTFAHHPYVSNGEHGDAGHSDGVPTLGENIKMFFETAVCDQVDIHFAGHDHDLQWLAPVDSCGKTEFIVSGAGAKTRSLGDPTRNSAHFQQGDTLGFFWCEVDGDTFTATAYDAKANALYTRSVLKA